ncbi:hypothetical protein EDC96DRAFT_64218 [Choanephora cucurbitarum]|nr:hypothetical protein EDC96DRAFT_64218 [Choanephora cucurbitarum]
MPSAISENIKSAIHLYLQERKEANEDASAYAFVNTHVELVRTARDLMPNYQIFIRRTLQSIAKDLDMKVVETSIIRWKKLLDSDAETTISTIPTITSSSSSVRQVVTDISQWKVSISNQQLMVKGVDVEALFNEFKQQSYNAVMNNDPSVGIQEIAALDNILILENLKDSSGLVKEVFGSTPLHELRLEQQRPYKEIKDKFPSDLKDDIEEILDEYSKENDLYEADKKIGALYSKAENHDVFRIIKCIANLLDEVSEEELVVSENHLTASFIHVIMKAIFKKDTKIFPHMSNHKAGDSSWRPDYKISRVQEGRARQECFGEVKPFSCKDSGNKAKDIIKAIKYSRKAITKFKFNFLITFVAQNDVLRFFVTRHLSDTMFVAAQVESFKLPTTTSEISQIGLTLTKLLRLSKLHTTCKPDTISAKEDVDLSESVIDSLF